MFDFNWKLFNPRMGLIFTVGCLVVFSIPPQEHFSAMAGGVSALLAWLTIVLAPDTPRGRHLLGLLVYAVVGALLTWLAARLAPHSDYLVLSMGLVTFAGYMCMLKGIHAFFIGWCLVYWYLLLPLFFVDGEMGPVLNAHLLGSALVIVLNSIKPIWSYATRSRRNEPSLEEESTLEGPPPSESTAFRFAASFATVVSLTIMAGLYLGIRFLTSDPTLIANATVNMISPSLRQTWISAVERLVLGTAGLLSGFYLGWFFPEPWVGTAVLVIAGFFTMALVFVNFGLLVGVMFFLIAYQWGTLQSDMAHQIGNEKLLGEFVGVVMALIAIGILTLIQRKWGGSQSA